MIKRCEHCKEIVYIPTNEDQELEYRFDPKRRSIQEIFPELSPGLREILISGVCESCFDKLCGE